MLRYLIKGSNILYRDGDGGLKVCVDQANTRLILEEYHSRAIGGYFGRDLTVQHIREKFWWPTLWKDVTVFVKMCDRCQRYEPKEHNNPLQPYCLFYHSSMYTVTCKAVTIAIFVLTSE